MLIGILKALSLPPQCTFWRFLAWLHLRVAQQLREVQRQMRQRVWEAANVKLTSVTFDTDTTVHTVYGKQMGARKGYNPKNKGKKSFQPILTFLAETREFVAGELRNGDRPTGTQIAKHLNDVMTTAPKGVKVIYGRAVFLSLGISRGTGLSTDTCSSFASDTPVLLLVESCPIFCNVAFGSVAALTLSRTAGEPTLRREAVKASTAQSSVQTGSRPALEAGIKSPARNGKTAFLIFLNW